MLGCLRVLCTDDMSFLYHGCLKVSWYPKMDHFFEKYAFIIFRQILFKPLLYKKFQKKKIVSTQRYRRKKVRAINFL